MPSTYRAGLDDSGSGMAFAVMNEKNEVVLDEFIPMNSRISTNLPVRMQEVLQSHQIDFDEIREWSVGAGPGSFTGLRLASSFVMGLTYGKTNVRTRCVSTASMIAACAGTEAENILVLFDGRKKEILTFGLKRCGTDYQETGYHTVIRSREDADRELKQFDAAAAFSADHDAFIAVTGADTAGKIRRIKRLSAVPLIQYVPGDFSRSLSDLFYLRPAVFVEPKKLRDIPEA